MNDKEKLVKQLNEHRGWLVDEAYNLYLEYDELLYCQDAKEELDYSIALFAKNINKFLALKKKIEDNQK